MTIEKAKELASKVNRLKEYEIIERCLYDLREIKIDNKVISYYLEPALLKIIQKYYEEKISSLKKEIEEIN